MKAFSVGKLAEYFTKKTGIYVPPWQVSGAVSRLVEAGEMEDRRVGRQRVIFDEDVRVVALQLGLSLAKEGGRDER